MVPPPMDRDFATNALPVRPASMMHPKSLAQGLRAITTLALCAASIFLFAWELTDERAGDFLRQNVLRLVARQALFGHMVTAAAATAAVTVAYVSLGHEGRRLAERLARFVAPAACPFEIR